MQLAIRLPQLGDLRYTHPWTPNRTGLDFNPTQPQLTRATPSFASCSA